MNADIPILSEQSAHDHKKQLTKSCALSHSNFHPPSKRRSWWLFRMGFHPNILPWPSCRHKLAMKVGHGMGTTASCWFFGHLTQQYPFCWFGTFNEQLVSVCVINIALFQLITCCSQIFVSVLMHNTRFSFHINHLRILSGGHPFLLTVK